MLLSSNFEKEAKRISAILYSLGVRPSHRVAFIATTSLATISVFFALWRLGAIACPLHTRLPLNQVPQTLENLAADFFIECEKIFRTPSPQFTPPHMGNVDLPATLLFTSGSTSEPKIACHTLSNHLYNALGSNQVLGLGTKDVWLLSLPLFHVGGIGILFRCLLAESSILLSDLEDPRATHLSLVPTQLYRLIHKGVSLCGKTILLGGAPIPDSLLSKAKERGAHILPTYGMTETSSQITLGNKLLPHRELRLADDGEIFVRGPIVFQGYWHRSSGLSLKLDSDGWFATKDIGALSAKTYITILGRKDNLFISGGENIYPEEIERALMTLPHIEKARVFPIPDPEFGARPAAYIPKGAPYTLENLRALLASLLPSYKLPIKLYPLEELQKKSSSGKEMGL